MPSRVVKVYDRPFPSMQDLMFADPATLPPQPREVWATGMGEQEVALFCVNFKSETPVREDTGSPGSQSDEMCRIFSDIAEAEEYAGGIVKRHRSTICLLRCRSGVQLKRISNTAFLSRFALAAWVAVGIWFLLTAAIGVGIFWIFYGLITGSWPGINRHIPRFSWWQWGAFLAGGAVLGLTTLLLKVWFTVKRRAARLVGALNASISGQEKERYAEIDRLAVSPRPEDRKKARELAAEYQERVFKIRGQMN